jgi:hypothetical protein
MFARHAITVVAILAIGVPANWTSGALAQDTKPDDSAGSIRRVETPVGDLIFENGIPSKESVQKLYDAMDFQRAVQATFGPHRWSISMNGPAR